MKAALVPLGEPVALSVTVCADPLVTVVEIVDVAVAPWTTLTLAGLAAIEKSFSGPVPNATSSSSA